MASKGNGRGLDIAREKMRQAGVDEVAIDTFAHYYRLLEHGETGMIAEDTIEPLDMEALADVDVADDVAAEAVGWLAGAGDYDLAVCDPPYAYDGWDALLAALPAPLAVLEAGHEVDPGEGWAVVRAKRYGSTVVIIIRRTTSAPEVAL